MALLAPRGSNDAFKKGWYAQQKGKSSQDRDNPYRVGSQPWSHGQWLKGWYAAHDKITDHTCLACGEGQLSTEG